MTRMLAHGPWMIQATSCDAAGNCASTDETLTLPVRLGSASYVGFGKIVNPLKAKKVSKRVRVGWHWKTVRRHGHKVRIKVGGHFKTITVIKHVEQLHAQAGQGRQAPLADQARLSPARGSS